MVLQGVGRGVFRAIKKHPPERVLVEPITVFTGYYLAAQLRQSFSRMADKPEPLPTAMAVCRLPPATGMAEVSVLSADVLVPSAAITTV